MRTDLGRLEKVDLRKAWENEASEFTPWLAQEENIALLGDAIGVELEVVAQEKPIGAFSADILCKETLADRYVLIENQLEKTDHTHMGQLLTYAAGLDAAIIIWIAKQIRDEHRAVLDWLNSITSEEFSFFGLEIELWQIGDSPVAPKFNIVCQPNEWSKSTSTVIDRELTYDKQLQLRFWSGFRAYVAERESIIRPTKPLPQNWMSIAIGRSGFTLFAIASLYDSRAESYEGNELRAELYIGSEHAKEHYLKLESMREKIEEEMGESLNWQNVADQKGCKVYLRTSADLRDESNWPSYYAWLLEKLDAMHRAFSSRIRKL